MLERPRLRGRLREHEDDHHVEDGRDDDADGSEQTLGQDPDERGLDELAHEEHEQQRVEEPLGVADEPEERAAPAGLLLGERHRLDLVHASEGGLGQRDVARDGDQHHDDEDHRKVAGPELDGQRHCCSCRKPSGAGPPQ